MRISPFIKEGLLKYILKEQISFHTPGHKGKSDLMPEEFFEMDVTETAGTDDLNNPQTYIKMSQTQAANIYRVPRSFYLANGSTCGIYTMLTLCTKPGDKIIIDENCHKSVINAIIFLELKPVFLPSFYMQRFGFSAGFDLNKVNEIVKKHSDAKAVLITSPTYYGIVADIKEISKIAHQNKMYLLVDSAHGAHFNFSKYLPSPAQRLGADMVVESVHKTLGALNSSAIIHVNTDDFLSQTINSVISMYQTSSPSYAILSVMETAIIKATKFASRYKQMVDTVKKAADYVNKETNAYWISEDIKDDDTIFDIDNTRIVINFAFCGLSGYEVAEILREKYSIVVEMCDELNIVCIFTPYNKISDVINLAKAIVKIVGQSVDMNRLAKVCDKRASHNLIMSPRDAFFAQGELVKLQSAIGRISKNTLYFYPPGIPLLIPGDEITTAHIKLISESISLGHKISGVKEDGSVLVVK